MVQVLTMPSRSLKIVVLAFAVFERSLVGFHAHSGEDNHHGSSDAYGGDYEAQRHWMELTLHLPIGDWYWYDLNYWGLDYPPLTAYVSYLCGVLSACLVGPETVELDASRGYEHPVHKAYMRATVVVLDLLVCMPAFWIIAQAMYKNHNKKFMWAVLLAFCQPAILLIDHGHFQYNTVSLGLALLAAHYMTQPSSFRNCVYGSILFCLALNFKQMCLYYSPAIFCYLLGRCWRTNRRRFRTFMRRFCYLGITVLVTFVVVWWPFVIFGPSKKETTMMARLRQVLHRIFPFQRGLFEGKVSNLWCALSVKPFSVRERIDPDLQPLIALALTVALILPACIKLFRVGQLPETQGKGEKRMLLWGMTSTGLSFFLASFQVHEKSILLALAPACLVIWDDFWFVQWFVMAATWTLWPLLCVDRLQVAYMCVMALYISLLWVCSEDKGLMSSETSCISRSIGSKSLVASSILAMVGLHVCEAFVAPPSDLPDLFPVLWSITGCGIFCIAWLVVCCHLYRLDFPRKRKLS